jgi:HEAT repeat protein
MDHSVTFARHFARLVWLLLHDSTNVDEQKGSLRALVTLGRDGAVALATNGIELTANGTPLPPALAGVSDVVARMEAHGLRALDVDRVPAAGDLLAAARALAADATAAEHPAPTATMRFVVRPRTPAGAPAVPAVPAVPAAPPRPPDDIARGGLIDHFAATSSASLSHEELLARFESERAPARMTDLLGRLVVRAEDAMPHHPEQATEIFHRIVRREGDVQEADVKRTFALAVKRLAKPALLKAIIAGLAGDRREEALAVLARTGEDGADALVEQLAAEEGRKERRSYYDALVHLQAGVPTLLHMLGDARWYVARNAAALLGEMQAREAESSLAGLLHHDDERVRHAATIALMRLGTPRSLPTIQEGLKDGAPQIRMQAAAMLVGRREGNVSALLLRALDGERDEEVAAAYLLALGRIATAEAVARLIATAEPDRGMFRRKPVALRVAATQALAEAGTPEAHDALTALQGDKDEDVRATAVYALGRKSRTSGPG